MINIIKEITQILWSELVGVFLVMITITATAINYLFFRSQIEPNVLVHVTSDEKRPGIIILVIENVGNGLANDIRFDSDKTIPEKAFGTSAESAKMPAAMKSGPLITGIPSLGPGGKRIITWGQYYGLLAGIGNNVINIEVRFKSKRSIFPGYKNHKIVCPIDIRSFEATDVSDHNWDKKLYEEVSTISSMFREYIKNNELGNAPEKDK